MKLENLKRAAELFQRIQDIKACIPGDGEKVSFSATVVYSSINGGGREEFRVPYYLSERLVGVLLDGIKEIEKEIEQLQ